MTRSSARNSVIRLSLAAAFLLVGAPGARGESPPLWGELRAGSHQVGFRRLWRLDESRVCGRATDSNRSLVPLCLVHEAHAVGALRAHECHVNRKKIVAMGYSTGGDVDSLTQAPRIVAEIPDAEHGSFSDDPC